MQRRNHRNITVKPDDVESGTHIGFDVENDDKDPKFKFGDNARISNHSYNPYCPENLLKILYQGHDLRWRYYVKIVNILWKKVADQTDKTEFRIKRFGGNVKVELDLYNYETKADWNN